MVGMPRISCFFRGAEPCILMLILLTIMLIFLTIIHVLLIMMLIMLTSKLIISVVRTMFLIIPCI